MSPQTYKVVKTHAREISVWIILSRLIHARAPHIGGMNGDVQSYLSILTFNDREQLEDFHSIIHRLQKKIILPAEIIYTKRLLFQYMKSLTKRNKIKAYIAPKVKDLVTFPYNYGKSDIYTG